jgi:hypothetical protein
MIDPAMQERWEDGWLRRFNLNFSRDFSEDIYNSRKAGSVGS